MGRRSLITITEINRIISSSNRCRKERENINLINAQGGNEKEMPPYYSLIDVEFNINTRVTRIQFLQEQEYRTIEKYVTMNYERHPIYSEWKVREKTIKKTLKLTNAELESLNSNSDELIRYFAEDIVVKLNNEELFPSWYMKLFLKKELEDKLQKIEGEFDDFCLSQDNKIATEQNKIKANKIDIDTLTNKFETTQRKREKKAKILNKISLSRKNKLKNIFSFGIYNYLISNKRKQKIQAKIEILEKIILDISNNMSCCEDIILKCNIEIETINDEKNKYEINYNKKKETMKNKYDHKISDIKPLENIYKDEKFMMLKILNGLEYEKIVGCYVIHNRENDKYYVGQSKDVIRRVKQHFNGIIPKNAIFAEDYYTSSIKNKEDLFEVKILKCKTKDELDWLEMKLIYDYDSRNNGYNGTIGNK